VCCVFLINNNNNNNNNNNITNIFFEDICMDNGTAIVAVSWGQLADTENVPLPSDDFIQQLEVGEAYT